MISVTKGSKHYTRFCGACDAPGLTDKGEPKYDINLWTVEIGIQNVMVSAICANCLGLLFRDVKKEIKKVRT